MSVDWSSLPSDLVRLILQKITKIQDNIMFCRVCKPWFNIGQEEKLERMKTVTHNRPPLLLTEIENMDESFGLYDVEDGETYVCPQKGFTPELPTSFGWFGTVIHFLYNPFTDKFIQLPEIPKDNLGRLFKQVILSANPSLNPNDYIVCGIGRCNSIVRILRPGDKAWTTIILENFDGIAHALFHKGHLYVIEDLKEGLIKINLDYKYLDAPTVEYLIQRQVQHRFSVAKTLVESVDGELLCIQRFTDKRSKRRTKGFMVLKLGKTKDGENEEPEWNWIEMKSFGNQTLFVGNLYSISVPSDSGDCLTPNTIYYAYEGDGGHVSIFTLEDQSMRLSYDPVDHEPVVFSNWISPTLL